MVCRQARTAGYEFRKEADAAQVDLNGLCFDSHDGMGIGYETSQGDEIE